MKVTGIDDDGNEVTIIIKVEPDYNTRDVGKRLMEMIDDYYNFKGDK